LIIKNSVLSSNGVYGDNKIKLIRRADVVVLPSYSENFGNIVAEALACERPVITTTGTPWKEIENIGCGYYIQPNQEELYEAMKDVYQKSKEELEEMGKKGRKYIFENFNWESKAKEIFKYLKEIVTTKDEVNEKCFKSANNQTMV
jgi:glycosyltransferase involved in cell wall biosynthesis